MLLIADSGSTKTDWRLVPANRSSGRQTLAGRFCWDSAGDNVVPTGENTVPDTGVAFVTSGINPFFLARDEIVAVIRRELCSQLETVETPVPASTVERIVFYGAGIASKDKSDVVIDALCEVFRSVHHVEAHSDLLGAARALCGHKPGIPCILGTGSNSCYYDGRVIIDNVPPCGYILGDEGGGAVLGKKLLSAFLKRDLPEHLCAALRHEYDLSKDMILQRVYRQPFPNRFLAQYAKFLGAWQSEAAVRAILISCFEEFFDRNVLKYPQCRDVPVRFTGSIATHFAEFLRTVAESRQLTIDLIVPIPIDAMATYHQTPPCE